jgi:hypothetical protein
VLERAATRPLPSAPFAPPRGVPLAAAELEGDRRGWQRRNGTRRFGDFIPRRLPARALLPGSFMTEDGMRPSNGEFRTRAGPDTLRPARWENEGGRVRTSSQGDLRRIRQVIKSRATVEGADVHLHRAIGFGSPEQYDPFLLTVTSGEIPSLDHPGQDLERGAFIKDRV